MSKRAVHGQHNQSNVNSVPATTTYCQKPSNIEYINGMHGAPLDDYYSVLIFRPHICRARVLYLGENLPAVGEVVFPRGCHVPPFSVVVFPVHSSEERGAFPCCVDCCG